MPFRYNKDKMVRKRPQAQKGLSPEKKVRREDSANGTIKQANRESASAGKEKKELLNGISEGNTIWCNYC